MKNKFILTNVTMIDGMGNKPRANMAVIVNGKRIEQVLPAEEAGEISDCEVRDMRGLYLMPGIIDAHVHLSGVKSDRVSAFTIHPVVRVYKGMVQAQEMMSYGVTAVRDISPNGLYLKRMVQKGEITAPRIVACGPGIARRGGHADIPELPFEWVENEHLWGSNHYWGVFADGADEIRKMVRLHLREGADQIKFWASGGGYSTVDRADDTHYTLDECKVFVEEAKLIPNMRVLSHACDYLGLKYSLEAGVDSIEHGNSLDEELAEIMAKNKVYYIPTINLSANWYLTRTGKNAVETPPVSVEYGPFRIYDTLSEIAVDGQALRDHGYWRVKMAFDKGVKIALGSDSVRDITTKYGEFTIREMKALAETGLGNLEAIRSGTQIAAEAIGLGNQLGTIEAGKLADMILVRGNPADSLDVLMDRRNIRCIYQDGDLKVEDGRMLNFGGPIGANMDV
jgi:imidazolonepropionase-like amidohydrolase